MSNDQDHGQGKGLGRVSGRLGLDALARLYSAPLARYFRRAAGSDTDVPDLVQDVLTRLAQLRDLSTIEKPEHYIFRTASNTLRDHARRNHIRHRSDHIEFDPDHHAGSDFSSERVYAGREAVKAVQVALRALPERTRDVFVLRVLEEQKTADVARALGLSTRAVESHLAKALAHLAAVLKDHRDD
jgi:RNA polymerase sigma factor (sigma-70 family)